MLTKTQRTILQDMLDTGEDMVVEGLQVWIGDRRSSRATLKAFLRCCVVKDVSDVKGLDRYIAKDDIARAVLARPELADEIEMALLRLKSFTIQDNQVVLI